MTVKEITQDYMENNGFDTLYLADEEEFLNPCSCELPNIMDICEGTDYCGACVPIKSSELKESTPLQEDDFEIARPIQDCECEECQGLWRQGLPKENETCTS